MTIFLAVLGSLGGVAAFIAAVWVIVRAIFRQVGATEDNTVELRKLSEEMKALRGTVTIQGERIARLEGRPL